MVKKINNEPNVKKEGGNPSITSFCITLADVNNTPTKFDDTWRKVV